MSTLAAFRRVAARASIIRSAGQWATPVSAETRSPLLMKFQPFSSKAVPPVISQQRAQSTVTAEEEDAAAESSEDLAELANKLDQTHLDESHMSNNTGSEVQDFTSNKEKSGTPSPWAVFDAWGAGE
eukprot:scaffold11712_cov31-Attheya_sp.AAC.1